MECDDGNLASGDGCSRYCEIENGFVCSGGSTTSADVCTDKRQPLPSLELVSSKNTLYITFDEEVSLQLPLKENIEIIVDGPS